MISKLQKNSSPLEVAHSPGKKSVVRLLWFQQTPQRTPGAIFHYTSADLADEKPLPPSPSSPAVQWPSLPDPSLVQLTSSIGGKIKVGGKGRSRTVFCKVRSLTPSAGKSY